MIRDNRPYTNENGFVDEALITDKEVYEYETVMKWIKLNIRQNDAAVESKTSYSIKHMLERDTEIYLTNNAFKDAMMFAGYMPIDENELYWRYRITLVAETNDNPSPFFKWVVENYADAKSPLGDFARDTEHDMTFPALANHDVILRYLEYIFACNEAIHAFEALWSEYCSKIAK